MTSSQVQFTRKRRTAHELRIHWAQQFREFERSNLTLRDFCRERELRYDQAKYWKRQLEKNSAQIETTPQKTGKPAAFIPVTLTDGISQGVSGVELHYPPYRLVVPETTDVRFIQALLGVLKAATC